jgi:3,4-dihydroxy-2-butanone 4-phosphate synthase
MRALFVRALFNMIRTGRSDFHIPWDIFPFNGSACHLGQRAGRMEREIQAVGPKSLPVYVVPAIHGIASVF